MDKPNILYVFADQLRYSALGFMGNRIVRTPNLDSLAEQGVVFGEAFSSCPICSPYRAQFLSGMYAHKNGVMDNEYKLKTTVTTLPVSLKAAGYSTGYVGKWHLGYGPYPPEKRYGFDYMAAYNLNHNYFQGSYHENDDGPYQMNGWQPEAETSLAIGFMEKHVAERGSEPFFLVLSWGPPHHPYDQYPRKYNVYDPAEVDIPPNIPMEDVFKAKGEIADYYGNVTALDGQMGRLMESLDKLGVSDNTILCFTSDHGDHIWSHGYGKCSDLSMPLDMRASKATPFEESIHIPFTARWPKKIKPGRRTDALFSSVDVMPSLLRLCGAEIPGSVQGTDLSSLFIGENGPRQDSVYLQILGEGWPHRGKWVGFWRGVRTKRYLYARWYENFKGPYLFDIEADPYEMNNLYDNPEYKGLRDEMETRLKKWLADTADPFDTGGRDPKTGMLLLGQEFIDEKWRAAP